MVKIHSSGFIFPKSSQKDLGRLGYREIPAGGPEAKSSQAPIDIGVPNRPKRCVLGKWHNLDAWNRSDSDLGRSLKDEG